MFDHFNFKFSDGKVIRRLLDGYSEKFDFHFINTVHLKTIYDLESELIERENKTKHEITALKKENEEIKKEQERMNEMVIKIGQNEEKNKEDTIQTIRVEIEKVILQQEEKLKEKDETILKLKNEMNKKIEQMKEQYDKQIRDQQDDFTRQLKVLNDQIRELSEKVEENLKKEKTHHQTIACMFSGNESNLKGIISQLGNEVTLSAGGKLDSGCPLSNLRVYNNYYFYNYSGQTPSSELDSYIKFDFGPSKKIDLYSYFIRSNGNGVSMGDHPKTWRIEGSNDDVKWTKLDRRENDKNLNGIYKQHHFECQLNNHSNESSRYRYIRYVQEDTWWSNRPYHVWITYFELYGNIYSK